MEDILIEFISKYFNSNRLNPYNKESVSIGDKMMADMLSAYPEINSIEEYSGVTVIVSTNEWKFCKTRDLEFNLGHFGSIASFKVGKNTTAHVHEHVGWRHRD